MDILNQEQLAIDTSSIFGNTVSGIIGGLIAAAIIKLSYVLKRPQLKISFDEKDTFDVMPDAKTGKPALFVHLNIENTRSTMAYGCKVFLLKMERKYGIEFKCLGIKPHLNLHWANENPPKGFEGLEIPGNYRRRVDFIHSLKGLDFFRLFIEAGPRGVTNQFPNGIYRFTIQASGKNTNTVTKKFVVDWEKGKFEKENIKVETE